MSEGMNHVVLFGNLGADPDLRTTQTGTAVLKLRLATTERYQDANKTWQERTEWHRVVVWGKRGEALSRFLFKGSTILVEGSLRTSSYEKDGAKHYSTEIVARNVLMAGKSEGQASEKPAARAGAPRDDGPPEDFGYGNTDDNIPF